MALGVKITAATYRERYSKNTNDTKDGQGKPSRDLRPVHFHGDLVWKRRDALVHGDEGHSRTPRLRGCMCEHRA